jgi:serine/threonine protein kinase
MSEMLNVLKQNNIYHADINPENLLIDHDRNLVLCDFSHAILVEEDEYEIS